MTVLQKQVHNQAQHLTPEDIEDGDRTQQTREVAGADEGGRHGRHLGVPEACDRITTRG